MNCAKCDEPCQKAGRQKTGVKRFYCKHCKKYQQQHYRYRAWRVSVNQQITALLKESVGVRGIARVLRIAITTVMKKIRAIASSISKPAIPRNRKAFELDEVRTYIKRKDNQHWIAYALCSESKQVIDFVVGRRSKRTLRSIVNTLLLSEVKIIKTDKLNIYQSLIPPCRHVSAAYNINHIERNNLNLRTHLKRLGRRTICFSKSVAMLEACLKIYFWSGP